MDRIRKEISILFILVSCYFLSFSTVCFGEETTSFCLVTIPKSGTHLVIKCLEELTEKNSVHVPSFELLEKYEKNPKVFQWAHFHQVPVVKKLLSAPRTKYIFNIRDLRDVCIACVYRGINECGPQLKPVPYNWLQLPLQRQISTYLLPRIWESSFLDSCKPLGSFLSYFDRDDVYVCCFEKLVGSQGGGTDQEQLQEIHNLANFLEIPLTDEQAHQIASHLFGDSETFRKGQIGEWKELFDEENIALFNLELADLQKKLGYS